MARGIKQAEVVEEVEPEVVEPTVSNEVSED